jgi:hypothetical protein
MRIFQKYLYRIMNYYPPLWGAGIRITRVSADRRTIDVVLKLRFWNRNFVGTHYGGSLYSMCDPFFMLILIEKLGREYTVWDKAAAIKFIRPGRGTVRARFEVPVEKIESIKEDLKTKEKAEYEFQTSIVNQDNEVVAEVSKRIHVRRKGTSSFMSAK